MTNNKITNILYSEHDNILKLKNIVGKLINLWNENTQNDESTLQSIIEICKNYADKIHHFKEEQLLFPTLCEYNPVLENGIVSEMIEHHELFREMLQRAGDKLSKKDYHNALLDLKKYFELLEDHIIIENNELFPMAEDSLNSNQLEKLFFQAIDFDAEFSEQKKEYENKINSLYNKFNH
ncbi:MAG TPA: hemerythrin domain-containing protein [Bacteroidia bacterium]|nr:hemerythrin domain-containing protein [Bacteroidia bacterium]